MNTRYFVITFNFLKGHHPLTKVVQSLTIGFETTLGNVADAKFHKYSNMGASILLCI